MSPKKTKQSTSAKPNNETETNLNAVQSTEKQNRTITHNKTRPQILKAKHLNPSDYYDTSSDCYRETSGSRLTVRLPQIKYYKSKRKREAMEKRRLQLQKLPTDSSDSSMEEATKNRRHITRTKVRYSRGVTQMDKEYFWQRFNQFLSNSLHDAKRIRSSESSSDKSSSENLSSSGTCTENQFK